MGLFTTGSKSLSKNQIDNLNGILPKELQQDNWCIKDIGDQKLYFQFKDKLSATKKKLNSIQEEIEELKSKMINKFQFFSCAMHNAEPISFIDIGLVQRFSNPSTGDKFATGVIGYAIESTFEDVWSKNNAQEASMNVVKKELINKAISIFPYCDSIYDLKIEMQEMGASGNVFVYMYGTACKSNDKTNVNVFWDLKSSWENKKQNLVEKQKNYDLLVETCESKIPRFKSEIKVKLGDG